jgi:hypothetical protein
MMSRTQRGALVSGTIVAGCILAGSGLQARQKPDLKAFSGTWKLNAAASTNPNGPAQPQGAPGKGGGGTSSGTASVSGGGGADNTGFKSAKGPEPGGSLGAQERARFYTMLKVLEQAPQQLGLAATDKDVTLTLDSNKPFHHMTDGKKEDLPTGNKAFGDLEVRTKWEGPALKRTIKTIDGLTVIETYALSPDASQLHVSLELKSQVERLPDAQKQPIERIYDRAQ